MKKNLFIIMIFAIMSTNAYSYDVDSLSAIYSGDLRWEAGNIAIELQNIASEEKNGIFKKINHESLKLQVYITNPFDIIKSDCSFYVTDVKADEKLINSFSTHDNKLTNIYMNNLALNVALDSVNRLYKADYTYYTKDKEKQLILDGSYNIFEILNGDKTLRLYWIHDSNVTWVANIKVLLDEASRNDLQNIINEKRHSIFIYNFAIITGIILSALFLIYILFLFKKYIVKINIYFKKRIQNRLEYKNKKNNELFLLKKQISEAIENGDCEKADSLIKIAEKLKQLNI